MVWVRLFVSRRSNGGSGGWCCSRLWGCGWLWSGGGFWSCKGRVARNGVDVGLCVSMAVVRAWSGLLGFMKSWRGDHTVSLGGGVTVFRAWSGLLLFMKCGRGDHNVGLLGAVGGKMCRCGLCGVVLQDQGPGGECGKIMANGRWKVVPQAASH